MFMQVGALSGHEKSSDFPPFEPETEAPATIVAPPGERHGRIGPMPTDITMILMLALAGFLLGGAYSQWKTSRPLAIGLAVCGVLAVVAGLFWGLG